jgi:hypothetical protein
MKPSLSKLNRIKRKILRRNNPDKLKPRIPEPPIKSCNKKKRFATKEDAQVMCDELNERYALQEILAEVYYCHKHSVWHVGHNRRLAALRKEKK